MKTMINPDLLICKPIPDGYSWTITTRLGYILRQTEALYGDRDRSYTTLGVEFCKEGPQIWYPGNCKDIAIQLSLECLNDEVRACYQLAHEAVHLLSPTGSSTMNILEEGLAVFNARDCIKTNYDMDWPQSGFESYDSACAYVEALLKKDPSAIKKMRRKEPVISKISSELIRATVPDIDKEIAVELSRIFIR